MFRTQIIVVLTASLLLGFIGGALSIRLLTHTKLTARYIEVVDTEGNARIKLYTTPITERDIGSEGHATIEVLRADKSIFTLLSTQSGSLSFHGRDTVNRGLFIDQNIIGWHDDQSRSRMYVGHMWNENMREKYGLEPYSLIVFNEDVTARWKLPSGE